MADQFVRMRYFVSTPYKVEWIDFDDDQKTKARRGRCHGVVVAMSTPDARRLVCQRIGQHIGPCWNLRIRAAKVITIARYRADLAAGGKKKQP